MSAPLNTRQGEDMAEASPVRSILVINVTRIGDTLLTTPCLRAIAAAYPQGALTFLGHPKRVEVIEHLRGDDDRPRIFERHDHFGMGHLVRNELNKAVRGQGAQEIGGTLFSVTAAHGRLLREPGQQVLHVLVRRLLGREGRL